MAVEGPLSTTEVAAMTGFDVSTICKWARDGHIPVLRKFPGMRGAYLFEPDVLRLIDAKKLPPAEASHHPSAGEL
jgi:predicted DNA-binding transcriptional regulator AlpA